MRGTLVSIDAWSRATGARVTVRAGAARNSSTLGADGFNWDPALTRRPRLSLQLTDEDLTGAIMVGSSEFTINAAALKSVANPLLLDWIGSTCRIYSGDGDRLSDMRLEFVGRITSGSTNADTSFAALEAECDRAAIDVPLITATYTGGGGAEGDVELRGNTKPAGFGRPINVKPILINAVANIYQVDAFANLTSIDGVYENLASFGPAVANYASYAALAAAVVPEGQWATCVAQGMFRLGAQPVGTITCDPVCGSDLPGTMMLRWLRTHAGIPEVRLRATDFTALTTAVQAIVGAPPLMSFWTSDAENILELMQRVCASCNAVPLILLDGTIGISRVVGGVEALTLNRQGGNPTVTAWQAQDPPIPWWRMRMTAARSYYVNTASEIDYIDDIRPTGDYSPTTTYRQGMTVRSPDGSEWLYVNPTPSAGHPPPVWPTLSDSYWENYTAPIDLTAITDQLAKIASDMWLSAGEKPQLIIDYNSLLSNFNSLDLRYAGLNPNSDITPSRTAANTKMTALTTYLNALVPSWIDTAVDTPIIAADFLTAWTDAYYAVAVFAAAVTGRQGPASFTLAGANVLLTSNSVKKNAGTAGVYDAQAYSLEGWTGGCQLSFSPDLLAGMAAGINTDPLTDANFTSIDYAFSMAATGALTIRENGTLITPSPAITYAAGDVLQISYDGAKVRYARNGTIVRQVAALANQLFYFDSSLASSTAAFSRIAFSAMGGIGSSGFTLSGTANMSAGVNFASKIGVVGAWDAQVYSNESFRSGALVSARPAQTTLALAFGLNSDPTTDADISSLDYAFHCKTGGVLEIWESNVAAVVGLTYAVSDVLQVIYDNLAVSYYQNGVLLRTVTTTAGRLFFFDSSFYGVGARLNEINFLPAGASGISPVIVSALPEAVQIQGDPNGAASSGALPANIGNSASKAGAAIAITSMAFFGSPVGCSATISGSTVQITAVSAPTGSVTYNVTTSDGQVIKKTVTFAVIIPGGGPASSSFGSSTNVTSTTYAQNGGTTTLVAPASGNIRVNLTGLYRATGSNTIRLQTKIQYRLAAGTFADVSASEKIGEQAYYDVNAYQPQQPGGVNGTGPYPVTGLTPGSTYEIRILARKYDGTATATSSVTFFAFMDQVP